MRPSLATRVILALTVLIMFAVGLVSLTAFYTHQRMESRVIDTLLKTEADRLVSRIASVSPTWDVPFVRQFGPHLYAWGESDQVRAPDMPDFLRALPNGMHYIDGEHSTLHIKIVDARDGRFYVMYDAVETEALTREFGLSLLLIALFFILASYATAWKLAQWVVQPLQEVTDLLARWAPGRPRKQDARSDERGRLTEAFNRMQDRIERTIADQKEFAANFQHEVRTPLSIIRSDAELLRRLPLDSPARQHRLDRIIRCVDELNDALTSTYSLSQSDDGQRETVSLQTIIQDALSSLSEEAARQGLTLHIEVDPACHATVNPHALLTVVRNIVRNAIRHAAPATLSIRALPGGLSFTDDGPGIPTAELPHIFDRYFSQRRKDAPAQSSFGDSGIGLAIAKQTCALQGWQLEAHSPARDQRGTAFTLTFDTTSPRAPQPAAGDTGSATIT